MEKIERDWGAGYDSSLLKAKAILDQLDEIVDWINARDEANDKMIETFTIIANGQYQKHIEAYHGAVPIKPSIVQELKSGLANAIYSDQKFPVTRIFLPVAKYEELRQESMAATAGRVDIVETGLFHDIPVFSYSGDSIIYCTD